MISLGGVSIHLKSFNVIEVNFNLIVFITVIIWGIGAYGNRVVPDWLVSAGIHHQNMPI